MNSRIVELAYRIRESARRLPLGILVWGPGQPESTESSGERESYEKRVQIKSVLKREFPNAEVYFSEDPEMDELSRDITDQLLKQALQARTVDAIIHLDMGRGAYLELDHFIPTYSWIRDKMFVLQLDKYASSQGLVRNVFDLLKTNHISHFTEAEFRECKVATEKAVRCVFQIAMSKVLRGEI